MQLGIREVASGLLGVGDDLIQADLSERLMTRPRRAGLGRWRSRGTDECAEASPQSARAAIRWVAHDGAASGVNELSVCEGAL